VTISYDLVVLRDPTYRQARAEGIEIVDIARIGDSVVAAPGHDVTALQGEVVARAIIRTGEGANWPFHLQMAIATGELTEERTVAHIAGTMGRFAVEWQTVAEHLAEALRLGTADQVGQALALFDSTREVMEGPEDVPADVHQEED
jgi:hypothetical protein